EGRVANAQAVRSRGWRSWNRSPRPPSHVREALPSGWRRPRADPVAPRACVGSDDREIPRHEAGSGACTERRREAHGRCDGLAKWIVREVERLPVWAKISTHREPKLGKD